MNMDRYPENTSYEYAEQTTSYMAKVYGWMFLGLLLTAIMSLMVAATPLRGILNPVTMIVFMVAEIGLVVFLSARIFKMSYGTAILSFLAYALLNGITLSTIFYVYTAGSIAGAFGFAAITFGIMSVYGLVTKNDLTSAGRLMTMGLIGILVASVINWFMQSEALYWFISYAGVAVFLGLTAYDTQKIKRTAGAFAGTGKERNIPIMGALILYLDFINLFLFLLRIMGRRD